MPVTIKGNHGSIALSMNLPNGNPSHSSNGVQRCPRERRSIPPRGLSLKKHTHHLSNGQSSDGRSTPVLRAAPRIQLFSPSLSPSGLNPMFDWIRNLYPPQSEMLIHSYGVSQWTQLSLVSLYVFLHTLQTFWLFA